MTKFSLIVAATEELGIGLLSGLPWRIPSDMAFFKHATTHIPSSYAGKGQNAVIMGRVTWESIPQKFRPLDNRINIVISRDPAYDLQCKDPSTKLVSSMEEAFKAVEKFEHARVFVIGGAQIYNLAIQHADCSHILLTRIKSKVDCDTFFPEIKDEHFRLASHQELEAFVEKPVPTGIQTHKNLEYEFTLYVRRDEAV